MKIYSIEMRSHNFTTLFEWIGLQVIVGKAYLFNQGELGEGSVWPSGTTLNGTAVKLVRAFHVLSDRGIDHTILRGDNADKRQRERTQEKDI